MIAPKNKLYLIMVSFLVLVLIPWTDVHARSAIYPDLGSATSPESFVQSVAGLQTQVAFPASGVLDGFNRADGSLGNNWGGSVSDYKIQSNQLDVGVSEDIYWRANTLGVNQEVYITLVNIDLNANEIGLVLKSQSNSNFSSGFIQVLYYPGDNHVQVRTYDNTSGWRQHGATISATFLNGDQFGARAKANGEVEVYQNGGLLATRDVTLWPYYADSGYIGLFNISASATVLDDFGGGTVSDLPEPCTDPMTCEVVSSVRAFWRCDIPECGDPDWLGEVITWPSWAAYENNARAGSKSRTVYSSQGIKLYPYMGSWADGCQITPVSGVVLIIEWQRGTNVWRETRVYPGQTYTIDLVAPEDGAMLESPNNLVPFSVSISNCTPQNIRPGTPTATSTPTNTDTPTPTSTATDTPTSTPTSTPTPTATYTPTDTPTPTITPVVIAVESITRVNENPNNLSTVSFTVEFTQVVTGVDAGDFTLTATGINGAAITNVSGSGTTYTVTVNTGTGNGSIRLDVLDNDSIKDAAENPLGGAGTGNGNFTSGEIYTIVKSVNVTGNVGIAGATLSYLDGTQKTVTSDGNGNYSITVPFSWTGTITPYKTGYTFTPLNRAYSGLLSDPANQDYITQVCANCVNVTISSAIEKSYIVTSGERVTSMFTGVQTGPVKVSSDVPVFTSERALFGPYAAFNEVMGFPDNQLTTRYWFPWYDNKDMKSWILVGNPSTTLTANVTIKIAGQTVYSQPLGPNGITTPTFGTTQGGPVEVLSNIPIFTSERALYGAASSFNEVMGFPHNQLTTRYWFPWYDNKDMKSWILVGNPSTTLTANVTIKIAGQTVYSQPLGPNGIATPTFGTIQGGPVEVISDIPIFTSERSLYGPYGTFNEVMGFPNNQLTTRYWFPWYDSKDMSTWVLVGNPSTNQTANVTIKIAGQTVYTKQLGPGAIDTPTFGTTQGGPVEVLSDIPIFTSERALYGPASSFNEVMGFPHNQLTTDYWFTWYDGKDMSTWILVGKP